MKKTLFVVMPCGKQVEWMCFHDLMKCIPSLVSNFNHGFLTSSSPYIVENRNKIARELISIEENTPGILIDYVLWLDSDMVFSFKQIKELLNHLDSGKDIVSGLYFNKKNNELFPIAYKKKNEGYEPIKLNDSKELIEVDSCGFGFIAMKMDVIRKLNEEFKPRIFDMRYLSDGSLIGEDQVFCERAIKQGFKILLDTKIEVKHIKGTLP
jgi:GT2 family glycosyltransferase